MGDIATHVERGLEHLRQMENEDGQSNYEACGHCGALFVNGGTTGKECPDCGNSL